MQTLTYILKISITYSIIILFIVLNCIFPTKSLFSQRVSTIRACGLTIINSQYGIPDGMSQYELNAKLYYYENQIPEAACSSVLRNPTESYNCHGYAIYMSNSHSVDWKHGQKIWIDNTDAADIFWECWNPSGWNCNMSWCDEATEPDRPSGSKRKIAYKRSEDDYEIQHTANSINYNDNIYYSKWGRGPLMQHECWCLSSWLYGTYVRNNYYPYFWNANNIKTMVSCLDDTKQFYWEVLSELDNVNGFNILYVNEENQELKINDKIIKRLDYGITQEAGEKYFYEVANNNIDNCLLEIVYNDGTSSKISFNQ